MTFEEITQETAKRRATELKLLGSDIARCLIKVTKKINEDALDEKNVMSLYVPLDITFTFCIGCDICDFIQYKVDKKTSDFVDDETLSKFNTDLNFCIDAYGDLYPFFRGNKEDMESVVKGIQEGLGDYSLMGYTDLILVQNKNIARITISLKQ